MRTVVEAFVFLISSAKSTRRSCVRPGGAQKTYMDMHWTDDRLDVCTLRWPSCHDSSYCTERDLFIRQPVSDCIRRTCRTNGIDHAEIQDVASACRSRGVVDSLKYIRHGTALFVLLIACRVLRNVSPL